MKKVLFSLIIVMVSTVLFANCKIVVKNEAEGYPYNFESVNARAYIDSILLIIVPCTKNADQVKSECIDYQYGDPSNILFTDITASCSGAPGAMLRLDYEDSSGETQEYMAEIKPSNISGDTITLTYPKDFYLHDKDAK